MGIKWVTDKKLNAGGGVGLAPTTRTTNQSFSGRYSTAGAGYEMGRRIGLESATKYRFSTHKGALTYQYDDNRIGLGPDDCVFFLETRGLLPDAGRAVFFFHSGLGGI